MNIGVVSEVNIGVVNEMKHGYRCGYKTSMFTKIVKNFSYSLVIVCLPEINLVTVIVS